MPTAAEIRAKTKNVLSERERAAKAKREVEEREARKKAPELADYYIRSGEREIEKNAAQGFTAATVMSRYDDRARILAEEIVKKHFEDNGFKVRVTSNRAPGYDIEDYTAPYLRSLYVSWEEE